MNSRRVSRGVNQRPGALPRLKSGEFGRRFNRDARREAWLDAVSDKLNEDMVMHKLKLAKGTALPPAEYQALLRQLIQIGIRHGTNPPGVMTVGRGKMTIIDVNEIRERPQKNKRK
jgi:hypothetical protein